MGVYTGRHSERHECVDDLSIQLSLHDVRSNTVTGSAAYPGDNLSAHPLASSINRQTLKRLLPIGFTSSSTGWREVALIMALRYLIYSPSRMDGPIVRLWLTRVLRDLCLRALRCAVQEELPPLPENRMNNFPHAVCVITSLSLIYVQTKDTRQFDTCYSRTRPFAFTS